MPDTKYKEKTHCKHGHLLSETRRFFPSGGSYCFICRKRRRKEFQKNEDPQKRSARERMCKYGVSAKEFQRMIAAQNDMCAICGQPLNGKGCVDHDHKTGLVRGILCNNCNFGLGIFKDNRDILRMAIEYLDAHKCSKAAA